ncbi:MAG: hypothetical protein IJS14_02535 [Lentisphaeria bacterium]|nr:hypothetical protein [Lentisphaeria bacterium]
MKRKTIRNVLLLLILTAATVFAWYSGTPQRRRYSARGLHASLPSFRIEDVAKITVSWRTVRTTMLLKDGRWVLAERGDRPASVPRISALLHSLASLAPVKELQNASPETLRELRLVEDDPKQVPGVRVELADSAGKVLFSMLLGRGHFVRPEPGTPPSQDAEGRYVLIGGKVYLIPVVFENCHPIPAAWVEPLRLHDLRKALRMSVHRFDAAGKGHPVWTVYRKSTAHPFTMAYPAGKTAENLLLSDLAERLSRPFTGDYYLPEKAQKIRIKQRLKISCSDGFVYVLDLADGPGQYDLVSLTVQFEPKQVVRFPGETDAQYQHRCGELQKRLSFEQGYSAGQVFVTSKELSKVLDTVPEKTR